MRIEHKVIGGTEYRDFFDKSNLIPDMNEKEKISDVEGGDTVKISILCKKIDHSFEKFIY